MKFASHQRSIGVLTRARALAAAAATAVSQDSHLAYLELRSRRLEKPLSPSHASKPKVTAPKEPSTINANPRVSPLNAGASNLGREVSGRSRSLEKGCLPVVEASCTYSNLELESRESIHSALKQIISEWKDEKVDAEIPGLKLRLLAEYYAKETTPCSLIRDSETMRTPDSSTRATDSVASSKGMQDPICQYIPSNQETEEFFVRLEKLQQQIFIDKYNFDPVNDCPLPGRYEWVKLDC